VYLVADGYFARRSSIFARSKPITTSPSMIVTGVALAPSASSSWSAAGSSRMFFSVNSMPF
jgi:hypothetical protein